MRAPFQHAAADHAAAFLEARSFEQPAVERPPGRRAEVQVPVDLFLGRLGLGGGPAAHAGAQPAGMGVDRLELAELAAAGPVRRRTRSAAGSAAACRPGTRGPCGGTSRPAPGSGRCSSCRASRNTRPCRPWPRRSRPWRASSGRWRSARRRYRRGPAVRGSRGNVAQSCCRIRRRPCSPDGFAAIGPRRRRPRTARPAAEESSQDAGARPPMPIPPITISLAGRRRAVLAQREPGRSAARPARRPPGPQSSGRRRRERECCRDMFNSSSCRRRTGVLPAGGDSRTPPHSYRPEKPQASNRGLEAAAFFSAPPTHGTTMATAWLENRTYPRPAPVSVFQAARRFPAGTNFYRE